MKKENTGSVKLSTFDDLIPAIMEKTGLDEKEVRNIWEEFEICFFELIAEGKTVALPNLGEFYLAEYIPESRRKRGKELKPRILFRPDPGLLKKCTDPD